ncbi:MAG: Crp/Fnr family transcriptional regulator [Snowella sp.]|nr:Crp/Fnr family transcriptional regulator [Snowella sp.]
MKKFMGLTDSLALKSLSRTHFFEPRRAHYYDQSEIIPLMQEGIWQVYRGVVQLSQLNADGDEVLLAWLHSESFFGLCLTSYQLEIYQAKALSPVHLRWYPLSEIESKPQLAQLILTQTVQRVRQTETLLVIAGLKRVDRRLQELLKFLAQEMGQPIGNGMRLKVRFTHQMLANAIGASRVTITRLLGEFQNKGWIQFDSDRHLIVY